MSNSFGLDLAVMPKEAVLEELPNMTFQEISEVVMYSFTLEEYMSEGFWDALGESPHVTEDDARALMRMAKG